MSSVARRAHLLAAAALATACPLTTFEVDSEMTTGGTGGSAGASGGSGGQITAGRGMTPSAGVGGEAPAPVVENDHYAMLQGERLTVLPSYGVLANDSPSDLHVVSYSTAVDLPTELVADELDIRDDGSFNFRPKRRYFGLYRINYVVSNDSGESATGEIEIRVVPRAIDLDTVALGIGGFVLNGAPGEALGVSLAGVEDVNGDGRDEVLIGAPGADDGAGAAYLVRGTGEFQTIDLVSLPERTSERRYVTLRGQPGDAAGVSVGGIGDLDVDGRGDIVVGAPGTAGDVGRAYVVFTEGLSGGQMLTAEGGYMLIGDGANRGVGRVVAGGGDVNGDGVPDILVSSDGARGVVQQPNDATYGRLYVVFGSDLLSDNEVTRSGPVSQAIGLDLRSGWPDDAFPLAAALVGDVDDDGYDEVFVVSHSSFVLLLGGTTYPVDAAEPRPDGARGGWSLLRSGVPAPASVTRAGDVDGDGSLDVAYCDGVLQCRVVFGPPSTLASGWSAVGFAPGTTKLLTAGGGDIDGDGFDDVLFADDDAVYVVYGKPTAHSEIEVASLRDAGYSIRAAEGGTITSLAVLGDVNEDGISDIAIGDASANGGAGRVYVLFGVFSNLDAGPD